MTARRLATLTFGAACIITGALVVAVTWWHLSVPQP